MRDSQHMLPMALGRQRLLCPRLVERSFRTEGVELVTTDGASASLTRRDVYFGELGEPYPGTLPEPEDKVAYLDIYINMPPPSPTPEPTPSDESHKPNDADDGGTGSDDGGRNENVTGGGDDCGNTHGMARYTVDLATASLRITDTPLEYTPPAGPRIDFVVTYGQRDSDQSPSQQYSNLGPNWTFNWLSYVTDDPMNLTADVSVYVRGGGTERYTGFDNDSQQYLPDAQSHAVLVRTSPTSYEKRYRDGSKEVFAQPNGSSTPRLVLLKRIVDPADNSIEIHYYNDGSNRIDKITDALGQETIFAYENKDDSNKITKVTDPFSRAAVFDYTDSKLVGTTDPVGISSRFVYQANSNFINSLTTPYGVVTFTTGESGTNRWLNMKEEETGAIERVEYRDRAPGIGNADPSQPVALNGIDNSKLNIRNTFYWDKKALSMYPPVNGAYNYTKAKITHWLLTSDGSAVSGVISSEKKPLESRICTHIQTSRAILAWEHSPGRVKSRGCSTMAPRRSPGMYTTEPEM